jgi:hypothetical protein
MRYALITGASAILPVCETYTRYFLVGTSTDETLALTQQRNVCSTRTYSIRGFNSGPTSALQRGYGAGGNDEAREWTTDESQFDSRQEQGVFLFSRANKTALAFNQTSYPAGAGGAIPGGKAAEYRG